MTGVLVYLAGIGTGIWIAGAIYGFALRRSGPSLPPATPRAIARVRRVNRADLSRVSTLDDGGTRS